MSNNEVLGTSITDKDPDRSGTYWRYPNNSTPVFNPIVFDETRLAEQNLITGQAGAGRGNTFFVNLENHPLVLRHYRRGGMVRKISSRRYVFTGLSRTRAMLEFDVLQKMHNMQLPVPKPFACRVVVSGATYEASIVTHRLPGDTLASRLDTSVVTEDQWKIIGSTIARFHKAGIFHADLNAHNIMLTDDGQVSLIDFDRAVFRSTPGNPSSENWCLSNLDRLRRSLDKVAKQRQDLAAVMQTNNQLPESAAIESLASNEAAGFEILQSSWKNATT